MRVLVLLLLLVGLAVGAVAASVRVDTLAVTDAHGGVTVHPDGRVYVGEFGNLDESAGTRVVRVTPSGAVDVFADDLGLANAGNDFDARGHLIQASWNSGRVWRVSADGTGTGLAESPGPVGVVVAPNGTVYVTACGEIEQSIRRIRPETGISEVFATDPRFQCPNGLTRDESGNLYTVNWTNGAVFRIAADAEVTQVAEIPGGGGHLVHARDTLFVAGRTEHRIYSVSPGGAVDVVAGTGDDGNRDGPADEATFSRPNGIGVSNDQRYLYVAGSSVVERPGAGSENALRVIDLGPAQKPGGS